MKPQHRTALPSLLCIVLVALTALPPATVVAAQVTTSRPASQPAVTSVVNAAASLLIADALQGLPRPATGAMGGAWQAAFARSENRQPAAPLVATSTASRTALPQSPGAVPQPPAAPQPPVGSAKGAPRPTLLRPEKGGVLTTADGRLSVRFDARGLPQSLMASVEATKAATLPANFALLGPVTTVRGRWLNAVQANRMEADGPAAEAVALDAAPQVAALDPEALPLSKPGGGKPQPVASRFWATVSIALPSPDAAAPNVAIARLATDGKKWELLPTNFQDGFAVAKTDRLGDFALVQNLALAAPVTRAAAAPAAGEMIVDDLDSGFQQFQHGPDYGWLWWNSNCGGAGCWAGHAYYTWNRSTGEYLPLDQPWNWATWTPTLPDPGFYKVEVFIPGDDATTTGANYQVHHAGQTDSVEVNQLTTSAAWINIGAFEFTGGGGEYVYLNDVVPEKTFGGSQIGFDAVRFTFCADPAACQPDLEPPVIHSVDRWLNGQNSSVWRAKVTDNVKVKEVVLIFNGVSLTMTPKGGDLYEVVVPIPLAKISQAQVVATDPSGNTAVFPPGTLINIKGYLSRGMGGATMLCGTNKVSCDPAAQGSNADPVNTAYGNFFYPVRLLSVPGPGDSDIVIELSYNSLAGESVGTIQYTPDGAGVIETPFDVHVEPFGLGWTFSLGPSLLILDNTLFTGVQVRYPDGRTVNFAASGGGFTPDDTRVYDTLTADGGGYLLKRKDLTQYRFDADGKLTSITDRNGNSISLTYDGDKLTRAQNSAGRWVTFSHNGDGQVVGIDAPEGRHLGFAYSDKLLTAITDGAGNTTRYQYSTDKRLVAVITPKGHPSLTMAYDEVGRVIEQIEGATARTTFVYDDAAHTTTMTDALNNVTTHIYDDKQRLTESRDALGAAEKFGYNDRDQRTAFTDREGRQWAYSYDVQGNRLTEDGPLGWQRAWTYNGLDLVTYQKDPLGRETRWAYDARGNLVKIINPDLAESDIVAGRIAWRCKAGINEGDRG